MKNSQPFGKNFQKTLKGIFFDSHCILELEPSNLVCSFVSGMPSGRTNNFPWKWACPRSRDPYTIFGSTVGYPSDSLASCCSIWRTV